MVLRGYAAYGHVRLHRPRRGARSVEKVEEEMRITVTKRDIANGKRESELHCPITLAMRRTTRQAVYVDSALAYIAGEVFELPSAATRFIESFDAGKSVKPISFYIE